MTVDGSASGSAAVADAYDRLRYPSGAFEQTHPERMAAVAHLHQLAAPAVDTARVLELGGGDGLNLLAMAATLPHATFLSTDVAAGPVAAGAELAAAAGLAKARVETADVLDLARHGTGAYDYIIAHGLYAWVPAPVRQAVMATIGRLLAPDGMAFISYNAEPGGRIRSILRDVALAGLPDDLPHDERATQGWAKLERFARLRSDDSILMRGLREHAALLLRRVPAELAHDELGLFYAPQAFASVVAAAEAAGLAYLNDVDRGMVEDGMPDPVPPDHAAFIRGVQAEDYSALRFFRSSLFVRAGRTICRRFDPERLNGLWLASQARRTGPRTFALETGTMEIGDDRLCAVLEEAAARFPHRMEIGPLNLGTERLEALARLADGGVCRLHSRQVPGVLASERPMASALARAQIARGEDRITRLDQRLTALDPSARALMAMLDGHHDRATLERHWATLPAAAEFPFDQAIRALGRQALLIA
jgi:SAM-dependent methyltransferase